MRDDKKPTTDNGGCAVDKELYSIGDVAKILNMPIKALRNYDKMGLEKPYFLNEETGYRYYRYEQFFRLNLIRYMNKTLRVPLEDIQRILCESPEGDSALLGFLTGHLKELEQNIREMEYSRSILAEVIEGLKKQRPPRENFYVYEQYLMLRYVMVQDVYTPLKNIAMHYSEFDHFLQDNDSMEGNYLCYLYDKTLFNADKPELIVSKFGTFASRIDRKRRYTSLPDGRYLCCRFVYSEENSITAVHKVLDYAALMGIELAGTAVQVINRFDASRWTINEYEAEIQILEVPHKRGG